MMYEVGSILSARNLWAVVTGYEGENYRIYFPFRDSYETIEPGHIRPIIGKYDLDKAYFNGVRFMCQAKNPSLTLKWIQEEEKAHE